MVLGLLIRISFLTPHSNTTKSWLNVIIILCLYAVGAPCIAFSSCHYHGCRFLTSATTFNSARIGLTTNAVCSVGKKITEFGRYSSYLPPLTSQRSDTDSAVHDNINTGSTTSAWNGTDTESVTIFDFASSGDKAIECFERIDDAVMGGISTSSLKLISTERNPYASWSGVCRIDGGGFCGFRTLPFREPLDVHGQDGIFVDCRLASDDEPERRVWKVTLRTDSSRGEMVYQAAFDVPSREMCTKGENTTGWTRVKVPFNEFVLVRGPRVVPGAPMLDTKDGLYQIGMSLSKFVIGVNTTELENFRPGYFDLNIARIGSYKETNYTPIGASASGDILDPPVTLTIDEVKRRRPLVLKLLTPLAKLLFSEQANRRRSAMNVLRKRGMGRSEAIMFGIRIRAHSYGLLRSIAQTAGILAIDSLRFVMGSILRVCLFYPLIAIQRIRIFLQRRVFGKVVKELPKME